MDGNDCGGGRYNQTALTVMGPASTTDAGSKIRRLVPRPSRQPVASGKKSALRRPVSRVLSMSLRTIDGHSSGTSVAGRLARPTRAAARKPACRRPEGPGRPPLFGLAPGGVYRAVPVAGDAVRSYRTLSPLPAAPKRGRRFAFCGTFPGVAPAGRYPAPCFRGARTFLPPQGFPVAEGGHPAVWRRLYIGNPPRMLNRRSQEGPPAGRRSPHPRRRRCGTAGNGAERRQRLPPRRRDSRIPPASSKHPRALP